MKLNCFPLFDLRTWPEPVSLCSSSSAVCIKTETGTHNWQSSRIRNFRTCTQGNSFILDLRFVPFSFQEHCFCENELTHFFLGWIDRGSKPCAHGRRVSGRSHGSFESLRLYEQRSFKEKEEKETKINQLFNFMYKLKAAVIFSKCQQKWIPKRGALKHTVYSRTQVTSELLSYWHADAVGCIDWRGDLVSRNTIYNFHHQQRLTIAVFESLYPFLFSLKVLTGYFTKCMYV